jgi:hypothetical protein
VKIDSSQLYGLAESAYILQIHKELGSPGTAALQGLLRVVQSVHRAIAVERLSAGLLVGYALDPDAKLIDSQPARLTSLENLTSLHDGVSPLAVQVGRDGDIAVWLGAHDFYRENFLSYEYRSPHNEVILSPLSEMAVPILSGFPSFYAVPYFRDLEDALEHYGVTCVRFSQCLHLAAAWRNPGRLVFLPRPEHKMRDSLVQFLRLSLRDFGGVEAMPEQNVNATRPVDVKVSWIDSNRVALVEIKWLGASAADGESRFKQRYFVGRAREGAEQLADYLDLYHREAPNQEARGYLAIFDGRRAGLRFDSEGLKVRDADYFRSAEISYDDELLKRPDFAPPIRLYFDAATA